MERAVRVVYGPTGGRFTFMSGVIDAVEQFLENNDISIHDRIGVSGGALSAAIKASGQPFTEWLTFASSLRHTVKMGGNRSLQNFWWLVSSKGLLKSSLVLDSMFRKVAPKMPKDAPCYAVSWCTSSKKGVAFDLSEDLDMGLCLLASCALPIAFSPVKIQNKELPFHIQQRLQVIHKPDKYSTFRDGGLSPDWVCDLVPEAPENMPVLVVSLEGAPPQSVSPITRLALTMFRSKTLDGVQKAAETQPIQLIEVSCSAEVDEFAARFDLTKEEGLTLYNQGLKGARETLARIGVSILDSLNLRFALNGSDEDIVSLPIQPSL